MKKIIMYVYNDFDKDDRVKKKALTLAKDYEVTVHCVCKKPKKRLYRQYASNIKVNYHWFSNTFAWLWNRTIGSYWFWKDKTEYCDIVDCNDPDTLWAGYHNKQKDKTIKIVYDTHEYWKGTRRKESFFAYTLYSFVCNTWHYWTECVLYSIADRYVCVSPEIRELLVKKYAKDFKVIANKSSYDKNNYPNIIKGDSACFIGSYVRPGADKIGDCFYEKGIYPVAIGGEVKSKTWKNTGFLNKSEFKQELFCHKYGILGYEVNCANIKYSLPNKLFEYIQAGLPIITIKEMQSVAKIVEKYNIGVIADSLKHKDVSKAIDKLVLNYDTYRNNIRTIKHKMSWENQEHKLKEIYNWRY